MLRVRSLTVNTLAVFGKRSVVSCISDNLNTPLSSGRDSSTSLGMTSESVLRVLRVSSRDREKLGSRVEEIGGHLHSGCKLTTEIAETAEFILAAAGNFSQPAQVLSDDPEAVRQSSCLSWRAGHPCLPQNEQAWKPA